MLLALLIPVALGARSDKWVQVAEEDLTFVKGLAAEGVRFGPRFKDDVLRDRIWEFGCEARPSKLAGVPGSEIRQIRLYSEHHCFPWIYGWANELWPCEGRWPPRWCKTDDENVLAAHLKIGPYFQHLTAALRAADDPLTRYNVMAVIADRMWQKQLRDYPDNILVAWVTEAASVYLESAPPEEALSIGWQLSIATFLDSSLVLGKAFRDYLDRVPDASAEQRGLLEQVALFLEGKSVPDEVRAQLNERYGHRPRLPPPRPPDRTDPTGIALLATRVDTFLALTQARRFAEKWNLVALDYREGYSEDGYVRTEKSIWRYSELFSWCLREHSQSRDGTAGSGYTKRERLVLLHGRGSAPARGHGFLGFRGRNLEQHRGLA